MTLVGAPPKPLVVSSFALILGRRSLSGSSIGGIPGTQEMLDFCGAHNITADVEVIPIQKVNEAYQRLLKSDVIPLLHRHGFSEIRVSPAIRGGRGTLRLSTVPRQLRPPHRLLTILEGESLLTDASALLIHRLAVGAVPANGFSFEASSPRRFCWRCWMGEALVGVS